MKRLLSALVIPCLLISLQAFAQEDFGRTPDTRRRDIRQRRHWRERAFRYGGHEKRLQFEPVFAAKGTANYADVNVWIADAQGNTVETVADGPFLFARLKPGNYTVLAKDGRVCRQNAKMGPAAERELHWLSIGLRIG